MANMCTYREPLEKHLSNARMALREWQDSASPSLQHLSAEERKAGIEEPKRRVEEATDALQKHKSFCEICTL